MIPEELRYTGNGHWIAQTDGRYVRVGITEYAVAAVGDVEFVELPDPGTEVTAGEPLGELESAKCVSELYAPVSGRIVARNDLLVTREPGLVNSDPYGAGWLVDLEPAAPEDLDRLLDARAYRARIADPTTGRRG